MSRMLPTTTVRSNRVGIFFELYGLAAADSAELSLTVIRNDGPGVLRRIGSRFGLGSAGVDSMTVHWGNGSGATAAAAQTIEGARVNMRSIVLNLGTLREGSYTLAVTVRSAGRSAVGRRELVYRP